MIKSAPSTCGLVLPRMCLRGSGDREVGGVGRGVRGCLSGNIFGRLSSYFVCLREALRGNRVEHKVINLVSLRGCSCVGNRGSLVHTARTAILREVPPHIRVEGGTPLRLPRIVLLVSSGSRAMVRPLTRGSFRGICSFSLVRGDNDIGNCTVGNRGVTRVRGTLCGLVRGDSSGVLFTINSNGRSLTATGRYCTVGGASTTGCTLIRVIGVRSGSLRFRPVCHMLFGIGPRTIVGSFVRGANNRCFNSSTRGFAYICNSSIHRVSVGPGNGLTITALRGCLSRGPRKRASCVRNISIMCDLTGRRGALNFVFSNVRGNRLFSTMGRSNTLPHGAFSVKRTTSGHFCVRTEGV